MVFRLPETARAGDRLPAEARALPLSATRPTCAAGTKIIRPHRSHAEGNTAARIMLTAAAGPAAGKPVTPVSAMGSSPCKLVRRVILVGSSSPRQASGSDFVAAWTSVVGRHHAIRGAAHARRSVSSLPCTSVRRRSMPLW